MNRLILATTLALAACSPAQLKTPAGQLFCSIQLAGGGSIIAGIVVAETGAAAPGAVPIAVLATNSGVAAVNADCAKAVASVPGAVTSVPVSPPVSVASAAQVAIIAPSGNTVANPAKVALP